MKKLNPNKAIVIHSGGQDSTVCLELAKREFPLGEILSLGFDYDQRHKIELEYAQKISDVMGIQRVVLKVPNLSGDLIKGSEEDLNLEKDSLPLSFVPGRNILFITLASIYAYNHDYGFIYTGINQIDYSGYPDCRGKTITHLELTLQYGMECNLRIITPLIFKTKAEIFQAGKDLKIDHLIHNLSHTCYVGDHSTENDWGYGCGKCPACKVRAKGWEDYKLLGE